LRVVFATSALKDYRDFEQKDSKVFNRINRLLKNIKGTPFVGLCKPLSFTLCCLVLTEQQSPKNS